MCKSDSLLPHTTKTPQKFNKFSYNSYVSLNLANIPVPTLPWPYYTIITVRTINPYKTQKDPSVTQTPEECSNAIYIIGLNVNHKSVNNKYYTIYY